MTPPEVPNLEDTTHIETGVFIWCGFNEHVGGFNNPQWEAVADGVGQTGVVAALARYADIVLLTCDAFHAQYEDKFYEGIDGVFDYEITEPMGAWVAAYVLAQRSWPTREQFRDELFARITTTLISNKLTP